MLHGANWAVHVAFCTFFYACCIVYIGLCVLYCAYWDVHDAWCQLGCACFILYIWLCMLSFSCKAVHVALKCIKIKQTLACACFIVLIVLSIQVRSGHEHRQECMLSLAWRVTLKQVNLLEYVWSYWMHLYMIGHWCEKEARTGKKIV